ncbi:MAG TPA: leucyl aminopeptidase [Gammaproteobacteria bacterium]|nr:leucyl aminopeptidase [Gammaproteobacteria bacterium]
MEFNVKTGHPEKQRTNCIVVGIFENRKLSAIAERLDTTAENFISNLLKKGDLEGNLGQTLLLHHVPNVLSERVLLVGCGRERELGDKEFRDIIRRATNAILQTGATEVVSFLAELTVKGRDNRWKIRQAVMLTLETLYRFDNFKSKKDKERRALRRVILTVPTRRDLAHGERAALEGQAIANGVSFAKNLGNTPPNVCTPIFLAKSAEKLAAEFSSISAAILDEKDMASLKMDVLLSVGKGSQNPPRLITLEYRGRKDKQKPIVLVGKGITFDTGGNSLKPAMSMIGMKYDMCGAAAVLGALRAAAELELPLNIIGVIAAAENMPGSRGTRPEDIVTSMSGLTVEILNTDAEGRLVLCDALTYSERFDPEVVIDIATLTSACGITFGPHTSALLGNHNPLINDLLSAGLTSGDKCWQLPLWDDYQDALNSPFADIANIGTPPEAGTILGACFLSRFTKKYDWAHLDIAGTAWRGGKDRAATGRPVPLLVQYLLDRCQKAKET